MVYPGNSALLAVFFMQYNAKSIVFGKTERVALIFSTSLGICHSRSRYTKHFPSKGSCYWGFPSILSLSHFLYRFKEKKKRAGSQKDMSCETSLPCLERTSAHSFSFLLALSRRWMDVPSHEKHSRLGWRVYSPCSLSWCTILLCLYSPF